MHLPITSAQKERQKMGPEFEQQKLKWIEDMNQREINFKTKMLITHIILNKRLGREFPSILERAMEATGLEKLYS